MDIKSTFLIFFVSLGIFAATLAYNLNLYLSSRNITKKVASIERAKTTRKTIPAGVSDNVSDPGNPLSLTNIFSPRSGMDIPGKWSDKTSHVVDAGDVSSDFRLSGTIYSEQEELRRAVFFFTQKREEKAFKEGDYVDQNTRLLTIERNLAVVSVGGKKMAIKVMPDEKKATLQRDRASRSQPARNKTRTAPRKDNADLKISKIDESTFAVDESSVDYLTENINKVITQVRIIPYFESGEAAGFRFAAIRPGSVFSELGFTSGDVIKQINGVPLTSPEKIYTIFQNLKDEQRIQVDILRRGQKKTIGYEIR
jgi:type II secretion system protein C